jgi:hypothetical protein
MDHPASRCERRWQWSPLDDTTFLALPTPRPTLVTATNAELAASEFADAAKLAGAISSCTGCSGLDKARVVDVPDYPGWKWRPFYADSQWCAVWHVLWNPADPTYCPVVMSLTTPGNRKFSWANVSVVADSLADFVDRFHAENILWYRADSFWGKQAEYRMPDTVVDFVARAIEHHSSIPT